MIRDRVRRYRDEQIAWRRHLHQHPEVANEEVATTAWLRQHTERLGLVEPSHNLATGFFADLVGDQPGPLIAIRTDIDALPIHEETGLPFASKYPGKMHACGHDMHMATVLGAAHVLNDLRSQLAGTIRFLFQPAEEKPPGGARPLMAAGALDGVRMIFGLHVDPDLPTGTIGLHDGPTMASVYDFDLTIIGQAGHAARPHNATDALVTAAEVITALQTIVARDIDPTEPIVITFGEISGGTARNVIAERVSLVGTARTLSPESATQLPELIDRVVSGVTASRGANYELNEVARYPVLSNDAAVNRLLERCTTTAFGSDAVRDTRPMLGGEDFACYLERVPGAMFRLGIRNEAIGADKSWHSPMFIADEDALVVGTEVFVNAALTALDEART